MAYVFPKIKYCSILDCCSGAAAPNASPGEKLLAQLTEEECGHKWYVFHIVSRHILNHQISPFLFRPALRATFPPGEGIGAPAPEQPMRRCRYCQVAGGSMTLPYILSIGQSDKLQFGRSWKIKQKCHMLLQNVKNMVDFSTSWSYIIQSMPENMRHAFILIQLETSLL